MNKPANKPTKDSKTIIDKIIDKIKIANKT